MQDKQPLVVTYIKTSGTLSLYLDFQFDKLGATFVLIVELDKLGE